MSLASNTNLEKSGRPNGILNFAFRCIGIDLPSSGGIKQKILVTLSAAVLAVVSFFAGHGGDAIYNWLFPDAAQMRVQQLQEMIATKTENIEKLSERISSQISSGGNDLAENAISDASKLVAALRDLQPDLASVGKIADDTSRTFVEAKQKELNRQGFSVSSDFLIQPGQGATVCIDRYIFGITANGTTAVSATLSGNGTYTGGSLQPGNSLTLKNAEGKSIQVGYQGKFGEDGNVRYGFSVICPK